MVSPFNEFHSDIDPAEQPARPHSKTMRLDIIPNAVSPAVPRIARTDSKPGINLSLEEFRSLFESAYDATLITDFNGEILQSNLRANEFLCPPGKTLTGANMLSIISGADPGLIDSLVAALENERYVRIHAWCCDGRGAFFPTEIAVYKSTAGLARHLCFFIRDITWRKEAEDRLQLVDTAMKTTRAGIAMLNYEGVITYANPALNSLCGIPPEESMTKRRLADFFDDEEAARSISEQAANGNSWSGQVNLRRPLGDLLAVDCEAAPLADSDGDFVGAVVSLADISDTLRAQEAERTIERNRVMMESIGTVCHHLGQPSTILLNSLEMLQRLDPSDTDTRNELLSISLSAAESLGELLRELNDLRTYKTEPYANTDNIVSITPDESDTATVDEDGYIR